MKNRIIIGIGLLLFCLSFSAWGQLLVNPKIGLGATGSIFSKDNAEWIAKSAFRLGADFRIGRQAFRFMPGLHYQRQGFQFSPRGGAGENINVNTLQIPVQAAYYITSRDNPINLLLRVGVNGALTIAESETPLTTAFSAGTNTFTLGAIGGLTLDLAIITLDLSYQQSLQSDFAEADEKGAMVLISLGYLF